MYFDRRLWQLTRGLRGRIGLAILIGLAAAEGLQTHQLKAGMLVIVPQNTWHRFESADGVALMTATPKPTEHLTVDVADPRTLSEATRSDNTELKLR